LPYPAVEELPRGEKITAQWNNCNDAEESPYDNAECHHAAGTPPRGNHSTARQTFHRVSEGKWLSAKFRQSGLPLRGGITARWNDQCAVELHHAANTPPRDGAECRHAGANGRARPRVGVGLWLYG